uniref:Selenoprotein J n=1 Tax=Anabas testudineus TaxID=64144 RepID=A0A3Q1JC75_ANATE
QIALSIADRCIGAIIGAAVAEEAAQPMHWIYSPDRLKEVLSDLEPCPEFRPQSANPFYRRTTGEQTCYGDQAYVLLESLSQCRDEDVEDLTKHFCKFFGPGTVYNLPLNDPYRTKGGSKVNLPIDDPWRSASLKAFMTTVRYAGQSEMLGKVEKAIRVSQTNTMCVAVTPAAARFLEHFILNGPDPNVLDTVQAQLSDPKRQNPQELDHTVIGICFSRKTLGIHSHK